MLSEKVKLSSIKVNKKNPRKIDKMQFDSLVKSILVFPKMLNDLRPIVVDENMTILGGNMRYRALVAISTMTADDCRNRMCLAKNFNKKTTAEKNEIEKYWQAWRENPIVDVVKADNLDDEAKKEFIIKDNVSFGEWDNEILKAEFDLDELQDFGLDLPEFADEKVDEEAEEDDFSEEEAEDAETEFDKMLKDVLYESDNIYEIPNLLLEMQAGKVELPLSPWGANSRLRKDVATYHFYVDDYRFEALFKDPIKLLTCGCKAIVEPNCSCHDQTPIAYGISLIYKKRWLSRYMQDCGIKVYADLNVAPKFIEYNKMGIPKGYNAFFTRGLDGMMTSLQSDLDVAREISGLEKPNLVVYGGGEEIKEFCRQNSLLYVHDFVNSRKK